MAEEQNCLTFSLTENVRFQPGQEVQELISISLEPNVTCHEFDQYVILQGTLDCVGEYSPCKLEEEAETDFYNVQKSAKVTPLENGETFHFCYSIPVDITIPADRCRDGEDLIIDIQSFEYKMQENGCINVSCELCVKGVYDRSFLVQEKEQKLNEEQLDTQDFVSEEIKECIAEPQYGYGQSDFLPSSDDEQNAQIQSELYQTGSLEESFPKFQDLVRHSQDIQDFDGQGTQNQQSYVDNIGYQSYYSHPNYGEQAWQQSDQLNDWDRTDLTNNVSQEYQEQPIDEQQIQFTDIQNQELNQPFYQTNLHPWQPYQSDQPPKHTDQVAQPEPLQQSIYQQDQTLPLETLYQPEQMQTPNQFYQQEQMQPEVPFYQPEQMQTPDQFYQQEQMQPQMPFYQPDQMQTPDQFHQQEQMHPQVPFYQPEQMQTPDQFYQQEQMQPQVPFYQPEQMQPQVPFYQQGQVQPPSSLYQQEAYEQFVQPQFGDITNFRLNVHGKHDDTGYKSIFHEEIESINMSPISALESPDIPTFEDDLTGYEEQEVIDAVAPQLEPLQEADDSQDEVLEQEDDVTQEILPREEEALDTEQSYEQLIYPFETESEPLADDAFYVEVKREPLEYEFVVESDEIPEKQETIKVNEEYQSTSVFDIFATREERTACLKICIVQRGDSFEKLAQRYSIHPHKIARFNDLQPNVILDEGTILYIPK